MSTLYLITGPAGVGKSTLSKRLAEEKEKSILIEGDDIYHMVISGYVPAWKENNHLDLFWKNVSGLIKNGLETNYDVIFNYIINYKDYERLKKEFSKYNIVFKVLITSKEELLRRDKLREESARMNERCLVLLDKFIKQYEKSPFIIDTTSLTISDTVKLIKE